ncbi:FAD-dependent monooxygenase [Paenibacillus urinalis]|uniref:FAD-dependent monooxygenase n=1 Tax=Paenibacillus urinalis TaxID=521520 RepID=A0AAX3N3C6_9BACL|nr:MULTISPECIES: FAD-dependent monooxygenase [Paenibacillus]WDH84378.1 FAD-dependent monooxygenase [Paenibacillus urinalis]WDH95845.1 FAD-dependent monooxygenase [Paenibacillus urinalis]WDI04062.1 FAD-dependent monooxygenase [Paenibacillus urinalis]GAK38625.1 hypothetical protein TCA2_0351 [Paenibacillus sp. TCA20]
MNLYTEICIVGAGPAGSFLAYLLAKQGISVILLERQSTLHKRFRGELINADGESLLKDANVYQDIESLGLLPLQSVEYWHSGSIIHRIAATSEEAHKGIHVPQDHMLQAILHKAGAYPHLKLYTGAAFKDYIVDSDDQIIGIKAQIQGQIASIHCRIIVGADGRASHVRNKAGIEPRIKLRPFDVLWARIPEPSDWSPATRMALIDEQQLALFSQTDGYVQIGWNIAQGSYPEIRKGSFAPYIARLTAAFPALAQSVSANIHSWRDFVLLPVFSSLSETWTKHNIVLIGDAAHTMTPTGAFGVNAALEDAYQLSVLLQQLSLSQYSSIEKLKDFETKRVGKVVRQLELQNQMEMEFPAKIKSFM